QLDPDDAEAVEAVRDRLRHADAAVRSAAAKVLGELGPRASAALPALLRALRDADASVRRAAATAVGLIAASPPKAEVVDALAARLKDDNFSVGSAAVGSLRSFGSCAWPAIRALREDALSPRDDRSGRLDIDDGAVSMLGRFTPPPVDILAEVTADK